LTSLKNFSVCTACSISDIQAVLNFDVGKVKHVQQVVIRAV